jgi:ribosome-associated protein
VNKASTQVTLYVPLAELDLSPEELERVRRRLANRLDADGRLVIRSSETRSQKENRRRAAERAVNLIEGARHASRPRRPTKPSRAAEERRLRQKRARSQRKRERNRNRRPPEE